MSERKQPDIDHGVESSRLDTKEAKNEQKEAVLEVHRERTAGTAIGTDEAAATVRDTAMKLAKQDKAMPTKKSIAAYVNTYLPDYLRTYSVVAKTTSRLLDFVTRVREKLGMEEVIGRENIPEEGSFLVVSNHFGGETARLLALFGKKPFHISAGTELNFNRSSLRNWFLRKLQMIPVKESLAHLSDEEKSDMMQRVPERSRAGYERILKNEKEGLIPFNREFVRTAVAALARGDRVAVFPEGLFTYGEKGLRQAYPGFLLIAREYKRQTGQELRLVPVGCSKARTEVGEPIVVSETVGVTDVMAQVAALLPEADRGFYADKTKTESDKS